MKLGSAQDDLIDPGDFDRPGLLSGWAWLLHAEFAVWRMNRFGDLFLTRPDGAVLMLDVGAGSLAPLADSRDDFARKLGEDGNAGDRLMIPLVDQIVAEGIRPGPGRCYSFVVPPMLGGDYLTGNTRVVPIRKLYEVYGSYHNQLRDVPDGAQVVIGEGGRRGLRGGRVVWDRRTWTIRSPGRTLP